MRQFENENNSHMSFYFHLEVMGSQFNFQKSRID